MRTGSILLLLALALPAAVQANDDPFFREWFGYCIPGAPGACASASLTLEYLGAMSLGTMSSTRATIDFTNLQGSTGELGTDPFAMRVFGFQGLSWTETSFNAIGMLNPFQATGDGTPWTTESTLIRQGMGGPSTLSLFGQNGSRLFGCDLVAVVNAHDGQVCGGFQSYTTVMPGRIEMTSASTLRLGGLIGGDYSDFRDCVVGRTCVSVPEPGSWLMLLTGLLGLGFATRRRPLTN